MTVRIRHLGRALIGLVAVGFVVGGLSVEAVTRSEVSRAQRVLPDALARAVVPEAAGEDSSRSLVELRRRSGAPHPARVAAAVAAIVADHPTAELHGLASVALLAEGRGTEAARHAQLAARLAPDDASLQGRAERAVDLALAWSVRPYTRPLGAAGLLLLLALAFGAGARAWHRRRLEAFLDSLSARVRLWMDGEPLGHPAVLDPAAESLTIDVFLRGRYGMACPRRPLRCPTLHLSFSNPGANRTVRLRPIRQLRDSAVRVPVRDETLRKLMARAGRWRLHVRLGTRSLAHVPFTVGARSRHASEALSAAGARG